MLDDVHFVILMLSQSHSRTVIAAEPSLIAVLTADTVRSLTHPAYHGSVHTGTKDNTDHGIDAHDTSDTINSDRYTSRDTKKHSDRVNSEAYSSNSSHDRQPSAVERDMRTYNDAAVLLSVLQAIALRTAYSRSQELSLFTAGTY